MGTLIIIIVLSLSVAYFLFNYFSGVTEQNRQKSYSRKAPRNATINTSPEKQTTDLIEYIKPSEQKNIIKEIECEESDQCNNRQERQKQHEPEPENQVTVSKIDPWPFEIENSQQEPEIHWNIEFIRKIEWREFEKLCCMIMQEEGYRVEQCQLGPDGGIDICIYSQGESSKLEAIAQCKAWSNSIGEKPIREFYGVMADRKIMNGYFFTSGNFYPKAQEFAKRNSIELISGAGILAKIEKLPEATQRKIFNTILQTDYQTPTCVRCGVKMKKRKSKFGNEFWGCPNYSHYPKCTFKINIKR